MLLHNCKIKISLFSGYFKKSSGFSLEFCKISVIPVAKLHEWHFVLFNVYKCMNFHFGIFDTLPQYGPCSRRQLKITNFL